MSPARLWQLLRFLLVIIGLVFVIWGLSVLFTYTYPFVFALLLSLLTVPLVNWIERETKLPRALGTLVSLLIVMSVVSGIIAIVVTQLIRYLTIAAEKLPAQIETFTEYIQRLFNEKLAPLVNDAYDSIQRLNPEQANSLEGGITEIGVQLGAAIGVLSRGVAGLLQDILSALPLVLLLFIVIVLAWFFITKDWPDYMKSIARLNERKGFKEFELVMTNLRSALFGYVRAQLTLISITFGIVLIGMFILRVDNPFSFALLAAIFDLLPYLGVGTLLLPWAAYAAVTGEWFLAIGLVVLYIVVIVQRNLAEPKIVGSHIGLDPLAALISIFVGLQLFGVLGFILGPVLAVLLKALYNAQVFHYMWKFVIGPTTPKER
ncbi:sporulation integral membrane protein YtvI [Exiguobacterium chiriqhucha]|uniref:Sporulation protein n=1 Tax=Exiguobacterium chiriqhucha RW-2 TaxID=1345023 RepID=U1N2Y5_9BACL|nr:sporulation integral membrane protein YtvI [Exiguobacterium chiriqhucha]ERG68271.1 sporulation protein [Exiguobacterium chiriqhucha RW-2]